MTKKEMAIKLASALFCKTVDENNWKVKDLMKRKKSELESHMNLADRINYADERNGKIARNSV